MVYESDFYTTRRPYSSRPTVTSYSVTTPRHYVVLDTPDRPRRAEEQYSYSYSQESSDSRYDSSSPYSVPSRTYSSSSERVSRSTGSGPGNYSYTTERNSRSSDQPGGYHSSYSSSTSGRLPHGTTYRHYSYRALKEFDDDDYFGYPYPPYRAQPYHRNIPYIGHKRLVVIQPSAHGWRVKQSSLLGEIDRIYHKVRPSLAYQPKEDYLNSRSIMSFDDETRQIRARTAEILKKIHTPVPRAQRPLPLPGETIDEFLRLRHELSNMVMKVIFYPTSLDDDRLYYSHSELPITERIVSDHYIDRLLSSIRPLPHVNYTLAQYDEPRQYSRLGKGHLACLTYAGGRPILRRKNLASVEDYIRDDINVLSHYSRFRQAAEKAPHVPDTEYGSIPHMPPTKSPVTGSWKSNAPRRTHSDKVFTISADAGAGDEFEATQEKKKKRREEVEVAAVKEAEDEKRRTQELKRQEELAEQAAAERQQELERKAREEEEEERILREEAEKQEALKKAQEEEEKRAREEEETRIAKEEEERKAKEAEAKRKVKEEAARKAEEERKAREEEEKRIREEEERKAREEEERRIKEEEELLAKEEEERRAEEQRRAEEERITKEEEQKQKALEEEEPAEEEEEKPEELEEKPQVEEITELEAEETENEPIVEEPQSPAVEEPAKAPAEEGEDEEEEENEGDEE